MAQDNIKVPPLQQSTTTDSGVGSSQMAIDLENSMSPAPAQASVSSPSPAPAASTQPTQSQAQAPARPQINIDDPKLPASELRRHLKEMKGSYEMTVAEKEKALSQVQSRLRELEQKRYLTDEDQKRIEELVKGREQLEARLYSREYTESPEYKQNFVDKINEQATEAHEVISSLSVTVTDANGNESTRQGSQADMLRLYNTSNGAERRKLAKELFGEDFQEALDAVHPMIQTRKASELAVKSKQENYKTEMQQQAESAKNYTSQLSQFVSMTDEHLAKSMPVIFSKPTDPGELDAYEKGMRFVDESSNNADKFTPEQRAARISMIRSMAGSFPRMLKRVTQLNSELAATQEELAKYRKSDPGNIGDNGAGGGTKTEAGGTDSMIAEFDKLDNQ